MNPILKPISVVLKEARTNKGISLEEAQKATKIQLYILRSLEEGTVLSLSEVYVKSYTKIYAKYLGISDEELSQYFRPAAGKEKKEKKSPRDLFIKLQQQKEKEKEKEREKEKKEKEKEKSLNEKLIVGSTSAPRFQMPVFTPSAGYKNPLFKKIFVLIGIVLALVFLVRIASCRRQKTDAAPDAGVQSLPQKKAPVSAAVKPAPAKTKKSPAPAAAPAPVVAAPKASPAPVGDGLRLTIFAEVDNWLQVIQDGAVVFRGTLRKMSSETWIAKDRFELRLNNAGAVKLELNGKIISPIGRKGQQLRKVVITKEGGLKIEQ